MIHAAEKLEWTNERMDDETDLVKPRRIIVSVKIQRVL
jgi:hypothetical protein